MLRAKVPSLCLGRVRRQFDRAHDGRSSFCDVLTGIEIGQKREP
jgi:hypothetical protein